MTPTDELVRASFGQVRSLLNRVVKAERRRRYKYARELTCHAIAILEEIPPAFKQNYLYAHNRILEKRYRYPGFRADDFLGFEDDVNSDVIMAAYELFSAAQHLGWDPEEPHKYYRPQAFSDIEDAIYYLNCSLS